MKDREMEAPDLSQCFAPCAVPNCDRLAEPGKPFCWHCAQDVAALNSMANYPDEFEESAEDRADMVAAANRLEGFFWAVCAVSALWVLIWMTRSFWLEWFDMVLGNSYGGVQ
jgi:hypothetical protein